jgi:hypothetical protein
LQNDSYDDEEYED